MDKSEMDELANRLRGMSDHDLLIQVATNLETIKKQLEDGDTRMTCLEEKDAARDAELAGINRENKIVLVILGIILTAILAAPFFLIKT